MSMRLDNQMLTQVIERCFDLSMSGALPPERRRDYLMLGKRLRGSLLNVLSAQFDETAPEFQAANKALSETNAELAKAQQSLEDALKAVQRVGELASKLDDVLKVADKFV
jgi:exonuclease VII small subunit